MKRAVILTIILSSGFCLLSLLMLIQSPAHSLSQIRASDAIFAASSGWAVDAAQQRTIPLTVVLTKTASLTTVVPGDRVTYTVQVRNATTATVSVQLTDTLPSALIALTMPTATHGAALQSGNLITWTGVISQAQQVTLRYSAVVTIPAANTAITNQVVVSVDANQLFTTTATVFIAPQNLFMPLIQRAPTPTPVPTPPVPTIVNGNFEAGPHVGWTETSDNFPTLLVTGPSLPSPVKPRSPVYVAWLGGRSNEHADLAQTVAIPGGYPTLQLRYFYWSASLETTCAENSDVAYLKVNNEIRRTFILCKSNDTNRWREEFIPVAQYANQTVTLHFDLQLDSAQNSNFFIDDVALCVDCGL